MSPENNNSLIKRLSKRLILVVAIIAAVYIYRGNFSQQTVFEFKPEAVLDKKITETGKITYKSGKISNFENRYTAFEKRSFSNNILTLEGKTEGDFDPVLKPLIKGDTYSQKIDLSTSYCPEDFVPHYPTALRNYVYFMPRNPLFDGQSWDLFSCGQSFLCSYSVSMKDDGNKIDLNCSGSIGKTRTTISGSMKTNENFDGFEGVEMEITSENDGLQSEWHFSEETKL